MLDSSLVQIPLFAGRSLDFPLADDHLPQASLGKHLKLIGGRHAFLDKLEDQLCVAFASGLGSGVAVHGDRGAGAAERDLTTEATGRAVAGSCAQTKSSEEMSLHYCPNVVERDQ